MLVSKADVRNRNPASYVGGVGTQTDQNGPPLHLQKGVRKPLQGGKRKELQGIDEPIMFCGWNPKLSSPLGSSQ